MGGEHEKPVPVYGHRLSTVVPAEPTGDSVVHELTDVDLAVKLHYLRAVYYFEKSEVVDGLSITNLKVPMFSWLHVYYPVAGRIRRSEEEGGGRRPHVKCNDCGLRIVEAKCGKSLEEWMRTEEPERWRLLVPEKVLGPDLHFSPLVYMQFTRFKCGGMAIGYSWSHLLGDPVAATDCINLWGKILTGNPPPKTLQIKNHRIKAESTAKQAKIPREPVPVKQVEVAGDCWMAPPTCRMATHSFKIGKTELEKMKRGKESDVPPFAVISALFWRCLAKIRNGRESKLAIICRNSTSEKRSGMLNNKLKASTVALDSSAADVGTLELASLIHKHEGEEELEMVYGDSSKVDYVLYGANLTFVDMEGVDLYGLELNGQNPLHVDYSIEGVGDEGAILVFQECQKNGSTVSSKERTVVVILPEDQIPQLDKVLSNELGIIAQII